MRAIASKIGTSVAAVVQRLCAATPKPHKQATKAAFVRFHDDKSTYTGTHKNGGPETRGPHMYPTLDTLLDRTPFDVRGRRLRKHKLSAAEVASLHAHEHAGGAQDRAPDSAAYVGVDFEVEEERCKWLARMTDPRLYTGTHKHRFDQETGKGLGLAGRDTIYKGEGGVGGMPFQHWKMLQRPAPKFRGNTFRGNTSDDVEEEAFEDMAAYLMRHDDPQSWKHGDWQR